MEQHVREERLARSEYGSPSEIGTCGRSSNVWPDSSFSDTFCRNSTRGSSESCARTHSGTARWFSPEASCQTPRAVAEYPAHHGISRESTLRGSAALSSPKRNASTPSQAASDFIFSFCSGDEGENRRETERSVGEGRRARTEEIRVP
jgi:hypothetical protein